LGIVNEPVNPEQNINAPAPILVTELGIVNEPVNPKQSTKAPRLILVTELGIVNEPLNPEHSKNALSPMFSKLLALTKSSLIILGFDEEENFW
jgi:hypothetical protein